LERFIIDILPTRYSELLTAATPPNRDVPVFISNFLGYQKALESMQAHESQLVWYRYLNVAFSRYLWVNAYVELKV
jgi:N-acetylglucosaminylphosphatidylinositol deacetylase